MTTLSERIQSALPNPYGETLANKVEKLEEIHELAYEWAASFPLQGNGSVADKQAANEIYIRCEAIKKGRE